MLSAPCNYSSRCIMQCPASAESRQPACSLALCGCTDYASTSGLQVLASAESRQPACSLALCGCTSYASTSGLQVLGASDYCNCCITESPASAKGRKLECRVSLCCHAGYTAARPWGPAIVAKSRQLACRQSICRLCVLAPGAQRPLGCSHDCDGEMSMQPNARGK